MIAIEVVPDRFSTATNNTANGLSSERQPGASSSGNHIRRPTNGIQLKPDTFATLRVVAGNGNPVTVIDAGSRRKDTTTQKFFEINGKRATDIYSNFFISAIHEERAEKAQILETFGEPYIFLFGERPRMMNFTGTLMNTADFNWEAEWWYNYDNYLRGSACVQNDARVFLAFDDTLVSGYIISSTATKSAEMPYYVNFQFQMFITSYTNISQRLGNPDAYPVGSVRLNKVSAAEINAARPALILPDTAPSLSSISPDLFTAPTDGFFDAISSGISAIKSAISSALPSIPSLSDISDLINGVVVRVPVGFEGDLVYDDVRDVSYATNDPRGGVITFTTFDQNDAEYVGSTSHYGSSIQGNGVVRYDFSAGADDSSLQFTGFDRQAKEIWAANGFEVPDSYMDPVTRMLVQKGIGLVAAGASAAWQKKGNIADKFTAGLHGAGDAALLETGLGDKYTTAQQTFNFGPTDASAPAHPVTPIPAPVKPPAPHALPVGRHLGTSDIENAGS